MWVIVHWEQKKIDPKVDSHQFNISRCLTIEGGHQVGQASQHLDAWDQKVVGHLGQSP